MQLGRASLYQHLKKFLVEFLITLSITYTLQNETKQLSTVNLCKRHPGAILGVITSFTTSMLNVGRQIATYLIVRR